MEGDTFVTLLSIFQKSFQSTPSAWRETSTYKHTAEQSGISIHSLRMEGDMATSYVPSGTSLFQSTPSAWRETCHSSLDFKACVFQSTPSAWRETIRLYLTVHMESVFQSTPSAWRETYRKSLPVDNIEISIHSLRMEGDLFIRN